jgi:hypothetical protein
MQEKFLSYGLILCGQLADALYYVSDHNCVSMPHRKAAQRLRLDTVNTQCVSNVPSDKHPAVLSSWILWGLSQNITSTRRCSIGESAGKHRLAENIDANEIAQFYNFVDGKAVGQLYSATLLYSNLRSQNCQPQCRQDRDWSRFELKQKRQFWFRGISTRFRSKRLRLVHGQEDGARASRHDVSTILIGWRERSSRNLGFRQTAAKFRKNCLRQLGSPWLPFTVHRSSKGVFLARLWGF